MRNRKESVIKALTNQALGYAKANQLIEAKEIFEKLCKIDHRNQDAWFMLGAVNGRLGNYTEAIKCSRQVLRISPKNVPAWYNLAIGLRDAGDQAQSVKAFKQTLNLNPHHKNAWSNMGHILLSMGKYDKAIESFHKALKEDPGDPDFYAGLGYGLQSTRHYEAAISHYRKALELNHLESDKVLNNMANALCFQGNIDEAMEAHHKALKINPDNPGTHSNLLLTLNYLPGITNLDLFKNHQAWCGNKIEPLGSIIHDNVDLNPNRRLRIGYVSSDFRCHSVAYFIEPVLQSHNHEAFEISCFYSYGSDDSTTDRIRSLADKWFDISQLSVDACVDQIRSAEIDILIDLNGHTANNRLPLFAKKPAPIQVSYLGYPTTTGMRTIDYRLTDILSDPPGSSKYYTESLYRMANNFLCYKPLENTPAIYPLPAIGNGYITFGSFNNLAKINDNVIKAWSRILHGVPGGRLIIKGPAFQDTETRKRYSNSFLKYGISPDRMEMMDFIKSSEGHLGIYSRIDIALDTFPYNGTTTTCESLWMGVPVTSMAGTSHRSRVGLSLLNTLGRTQWVADDEDQYVAIAIALAGDLKELENIRKGLRVEMKNSSLCDAKTFTLEVEEAYRQMWKQYCI